MEFDGAYERVKSAWERTLGPNACLDDGSNFYDKGGTSLKALSMFVYLKNFSNNELTFTDLMADPTIFGMSRALSTRSKARLIEYQQGLADAPIIVLVHPAGAGPEVYEGLIQNLPGDMTIVGIKNPFVEDPHSKMTLYELGAMYCADILDRYGLNRPYKIVGWSLGGLIGAETGWHLQRANARVTDLYLIDSRPPSSAQTFYLKSLNKIERDTMLRADMKKRGLDDHTISLMLRSRDAEELVFQSRPSGRLEQCRLVLFVANEMDPRCNSELEQNLSRLSTNVHETLNFVRPGYGTTITVDGRHHNDILEEAQLISSVVQHDGLAQRKD